MLYGTAPTVAVSWHPLAKSAIASGVWKSWVLYTWGFPKIRGTFFWSPYNKDPTI